MITKEIKYGTWEVHGQTRNEVTLLKLLFDALDPYRDEQVISTNAPYFFFPNGLPANVQWLSFSTQSKEKK
jgi:hypothetical protein